jgi:FkbM family methyltransferase
MIDSAKTRYTDNFYFYKGDLFIGQSIKLYGEYTQVELDHMAPYLNAASVVFDIGGNIGYHTVAFANIAKEVHSFEPNNQNFVLLGKNTAELDNVYLYNCACSYEDGVTYIGDYDATQPGNYGQCEISAEGQACKTFKIDNLNLSAPTLIKIDVEGHELAVFVGAQETIIKHKPVIFYENMHSNDSTAIYDFLTSHGYNIYWVHAYNYNEKNFAGNEYNIFSNSGVINCLAVQKDAIQPTHLPPVIDRDETTSDYITRMTLAGKLQIRT